MKKAQVSLLQEFCQKKRNSITKIRSRGDISGGLFKYTAKVISGQETFTTTGTSIKNHMQNTVQQGNCLNS